MPAIVLNNVQLARAKIAHWRSKLRAPSNGPVNHQDPIRFPRSTSRQYVPPRQAISACKLVASPDGRPFFFSKENFSNACMGTVDVNYKSAPLFIYANPDLIKGMLDPIFDYCRSDAWPHLFPAHDLGVYPKANGQAYRNFHLPGTTDPLAAQMPVEECGNMLTMTTSVCLREGNAELGSAYAVGKLPREARA